jgi:dCTP deaminase
MPVLSDGDIFKYLMTKKLVIHPILDKKQIQGGKIDLRMSNIIYLIKQFEQPYYDPRMSDIETKYGEERKLTFSKAGEKKAFILQPGDFAIAPLFERIKLPNNMIGRLDGRSSLGRLGIIVHATAGGIDPGYSGQVTCELSNLGKIPVALYPLQRIAALTIETISSSAISYRQRKDQKYKDQLYTMLRQDKEFKTQILDNLAEKM